MCPFTPSCASVIAPRTINKTFFIYQIDPLPKINVHSSQLKKNLSPYFPTLWQDFESVVISLKMQIAYGFGLFFVCFQRPINMCEHACMCAVVDREMPTLIDMLWCFCDKLALCQTWTFQSFTVVQSLAMSSLDCSSLCFRLRHFVSSN